MATTPVFLPGESQGDSVGTVAWVTTGHKVAQTWTLCTLAHSPQQQDASNYCTKHGIILMSGFTQN